MITFTIALLALVAGYFLYGRLAERIFGPDDRPTPALTQADGVDYWAVFLQEPFMITWLVCFRYVTEAKACPNSLAVIWV